MTFQILVVDDEPHMARLATYVLEAAGYEVLVAYNAEMALELLENERVDLALCDIAMSGMNGVELLRVIRADARTADMPVIMLTARGEVKDFHEADEAGANGYLTKPSSSAEILDEIARHLPPPAGA